MSNEWTNGLFSFECGTCCFVYFCFPAQRVKSTKESVQEVASWVPSSITAAPVRIYSFYLTFQTRTKFFITFLLRVSAAALSFSTSDCHSCCHIKHIFEEAMMIHDRSTSDKKGSKLSGARKLSAKSNHH